jgi:hypothetical protein
VPVPPPRPPLVLRMLAAACGVLPACASSESAGPASVALAPSLMPNLGVAASVATPVRGLGPWQLEARFTYQFLDDKAFADNDFPEAGDWTQLDLGVLRLYAPDAERTWTARLGLVGFEARGQPNLAEEAGDYWGGYAGIGRFTHFGRGFWFGPELTLVAATGPDPLVLIPQITWGVRWMPGRGAPAARDP